MENKNLKLQQMYTEAVQNQQKGNSAVAEDLYKKILKELPNHVNTQGNLGALYAQFGKDRVEGELNKFLEKDFFKRSGGGIGMTRMIRAMKLSNLLD